jgi:prepilin-type N-terminal cleavage/methylation domain-containing protein
LRPIDSERGFTLIEVLIATVIMTVGLVALAQMMAITVRMQMLGRNETIAVRTAQQKLDELVSFQSQWTTAPQIAIGGDLDTDAQDYSDTVAGFRRRWRVVAGPVDPISDPGDLRIVTVRVIPQTADTRLAATIELTSMLRNIAP